DDPAAQAAFAGAMEVLQPLLASGVLVVPSERTSLDQTAVLRGSPAAAAHRVAELLEGGIVLDGVLSPNAAISAAIAETLADAGCSVVEADDAATPGAPDASGEAPCRTVLTGGGTSRDGARALLAGTQSSAVYEDPRELARVVAEMVSEVVR